ncbi:MAG: hypothetical protein KC619_24080 [Myxococcales bacterium]|nr:hypothetical protein [Myxococcales bacterium]
MPGDEKPTPYVEPERYEGLDDDLRERARMVLSEVDKPLRYSLALHRFLEDDEDYPPNEPKLRLGDANEGDRVVDEVPKPGVRRPLSRR